MSDAVVLDASATLALILGEPGQDAVRAELPGALMSAVNAAEVVSKLVERGVHAAVAADMIVRLGIEVEAFTLDQAREVGALRLKTAKPGLSLGDRACLVLGREKAARVLTADKFWLKVAADIGASVEVIRA
jgi:PIN domain nuclease of toxin-antitoxin system